MILTQNEAPPVIGGDIVCKAEKYTISEDAINHIGALLEGQYRHPEKAVIREYVANALDAHRMFGVDKKVVVHLPVPTDPVFRVRDFGPGLSLEHTRARFFGYGASDALKRQMADVIGAKCGYTVSRTFTYTVWNDGRKRVWLCTKDESDTSVSILASDEPSDEPSGVLVEVPMNARTYTIQSAVSVLAFMRQVDMLDFGDDCPYRLPKPPASLLDVEVSVKQDGVDAAIPAKVSFYSKEEIGRYGSALGNQTLPGIMLGDFYYPIDSEVMAPFKTDIVNRGDRVSPLLDRVVVHMPCSSVQVAPSRETLKYSERTRRVVKAIVELFADPEFLGTVSKLALESMPEGASMMDFRRRALLFDQSTDNGVYCRKAGFAIPRADLTGLATAYVGRFDDYGKMRITVNEVLTGNELLLGSEIVIPSGDIDNDNSSHIRSHVVVNLDKPASSLTTPELVRKAATAMFAYCREIATTRPRGIVVTLVCLKKDVAIPWMRDDSVRCYDESALPEANYGLFNAKSGGRRKRRSYYSVSYRSTAPRVATKVMVFDTHADTESARAYYESAKWKEVKASAGIVLELKSKSEVVGAGRSIARPQDIAHLVNALARDLRRPDVDNVLPKLVGNGACVYAVRSSNLASVPQGPDEFETFGNYVRRRFMEDVQSGDLDFEALARTLALTSLDAGLLAFVARANSPLAAGTSAMKLIKKFRSRKPEGRPETLKAWTAVAGLLAKHGMSHWFAGHGADYATTSLLAPDGLPGDVPAAKLVRGCPAALSLGVWLGAQPGHLLESWLRPAAVIGVPECRNVLESIVSSLYEEIPFAAASYEMEFYDGGVFRIKKGCDGFVSEADKQFDMDLYTRETAIAALASAAFGGDPAAVKFMASIKKARKQANKETQTT
jgi:hypothetical protein